MSGHTPETRDLLEALAEIAFSDNANWSRRHAAAAYEQATGISPYEAAEAKAKAGARAALALVKTEGAK